VTFSITSKLPIHTGELLFYSDFLYIISNLPVHEGKLSFSEGEHFDISSNLPIWSVEIGAYDQSFTIESDLPVWIMGDNNEFLTETAVDVNPDGSIDEDNFVGVLRYIRP
jgi:hypothetical protein